MLRKEFQMNWLCTWTHCLVIILPRVWRLYVKICILMCTYTQTEALVRLYLCAASQWGSIRAMEVVVGEEVLVTIQLFSLPWFEKLASATPYILSWGCCSWRVTLWLAERLVTSNAKPNVTEMYVNLNVACYAHNVECGSGKSKQKRNKSDMILSDIQLLNALQ